MLNGKRQQSVNSVGIVQRSAEIRDQRRRSAAAGQNEPANCRSPVLAVIVYDRGSGMLFHNLIATAASWCCSQTDGVSCVVVFFLIINFSSTHAREFLP